jgi:hypothetical protein
VLELETSTNHGWMRHVLNLCYNDLPHPLKTYFLYLAVYPEDYKIEKVNLPRRWIAEGSVGYQYGRSPEEVAESFFNELINRGISIKFLSFGLDDMWGHVYGFLDDMGCDTNGAHDNI